MTLPRLLVPVLLPLLAGCPMAPNIIIKNELYSLPSSSCTRAAVLSVNGVVGVVVSRTTDEYHLIAETEHGLLHISVTSTALKGIDTNASGQPSPEDLARRADTELAVEAIQEKCVH